MPDERPFTLRQVDQARGDLYAIADDLEFIKEQLARVVSAFAPVDRLRFGHPASRSGRLQDAERYPDRVRGSFFAIFG
jgi:hypothetical protein